MEYKIENRISSQELISTLHQTPLQGYNQTLVYRDAFISIQKQVDPYSLVPTQRYVLEPIVNRLESLYKSLLNQQEDLLALRGGLWITKGEDSFPFIPPIVEEYWEPNSNRWLGKRWIISDGMHRAYVAQRLAKPINIILIQNVPKEFPYYAYPLKGGWRDVYNLKELPRGFVKKYHREGDYKSLYRNYNEVLPGVQLPRTSL